MGLQRVQGNILNEVGCNVCSDGSNSRLIVALMKLVHAISVCSFAVELSSKTFRATFHMHEFVHELQSVLKWSKPITVIIKT